MASNILTNEIASPTGVINIPTGVKIQGTTANSFSQPHRQNDVVQVVTVNSYVANSTGITSTLATETSLGLTANITPVYTTSKILVEFWSSMMYGGGNILYLILYRQIGSGSFVSLTPLSLSAAKYYYGWTYHNIGYASSKQTYIDLPATTDVVTYRLNYRNNTASGTNYVVYPYMEYGWNLYEIKQ